MATSQGKILLHIEFAHNKLRINHPDIELWFVRFKHAMFGEEIYVRFSLVNS